MKIFVINLARSPERRYLLEKQRSLFNLGYETIEVVNGLQISYSNVMMKTRPLYYALTYGEVGCALSHINIYRKIEPEAISLTLILEDDTYIDYRIVEVMADIKLRNTNSPTVSLLTEGSKYIDKPLYNSKSIKYPI